MSLSILADDTRIDSVDHLIQYFVDGCKEPEARLIGTEHEKFAWRPANLERPEYSPGGIEDVLSAFSKFGWERITENGVLVGMKRDRATITIEPGGQLELSGAPFKDVSETAAEFDLHLSELGQICDDLHWSGLGLFPLGEAETSPLMPKPRYKILEGRLREVGGDGLAMMRQTCTVQVNLDYVSEEDAMRKLRIGLFLNPIIISLFGNSSMVGGQWTNLVSRRAQIWETTDPSRTALDDVFYGPGATFRDYVEWSLDVPMLFIHRGGQYLDFRGVSFREFMLHGQNSFEATIGDYALHLSTLFPDVRLKHYLEIRGADMGNRSDVLALATLYKALFYGAQACQELEKWCEHFSAASIRKASVDAARLGFEGKLGGRTLREWGVQLLELARKEIRELEPSAEVYLNMLWQNAQTRHHRRGEGTLSPRELLDEARLL